MTPADGLLLVILWVGHVGIWITPMNITFGMAIPKKILTIQRKITALSLLAFPIWVYWTTGGSTEKLLPSEGSLIEVRQIYAGLCLVCALIVLPIVTVSRFFRSIPTQVQQSESVFRDVIKELGFTPLGDGRFHFLTKLPGNDIFRVEFTRLTLRLPKLPEAWSGMSILHLSDLHFYGTPAPEFYQHVLTVAMSEGIPDFVFVTGDFADSTMHLEWVRPILGQLSAKVGCFAVLGNHDFWYDSERLQTELCETGWTVLLNTVLNLEHLGARLTLIGHSGPWFSPPPDLSKTPSDDFRICLSHTPDNLPWCREQGVDLMLSGHVHGGQIRLPIIGSIHVPSIYCRRYDMGTFYEEPTLLHVNRGLAGKEPIRINCPPQVTRLILLPVGKETA